MSARRRRSGHVPAPPARPGQEPDFSYLQLSPAGAVYRPDVTAAARDVENLSLELVRVLDDEHRAVGPWNPHLEAPELQVALRHMLAASFDGGNSWALTSAPFSRCTGGNAANLGNYERATDPWLTVTPNNGYAYALSLSFNGTTLAAGSASAMLVARSTDFGVTWQLPHVKLTV